MKKVGPKRPSGAPANVVPLRPDKVHMYAHPTESQLERLCGVGWSVQLGSDFVTLDAPRPQAGETATNLGWALSPKQARDIARELLRRALKLEVDAKKREKP